MDSSRQESCGYPVQLFRCAQGSIHANDDWAQPARNAVSVQVIDNERTRAFGEEVKALICETSALMHCRTRQGAPSLTRTTPIPMIFVTLLR